jgi:hypothetical protein
MHVRWHIGCTKFLSLPLKACDVWCNSFSMLMTTMPEFIVAHSNNVASYRVLYADFTHCDAVFALDYEMPAQGSVKKKVTTQPCSSLTMLAT